VLNDRASEVRFAAAFALAEIGDRSAAPALEPLLRHSEDRTRLAAASALAFLDDSHGLSVLNSTLRSHDTWQRFTALISLLRLNTPEARKLLTDCHDQDNTLMVAIEAGLRVGGAGAATNMLVSPRRSESMTEDYRHFGARSLIFFNDPATLPVLEANANDSQDDVRAAVRIAIHRIKKKMKANEQAAVKPGN
jgi:HEAT repeat protein